MDIVVYIKNIDSSNKMLNLLRDCGLQFEVHAIEEAYITNVVGEKVKKLPHVVIDGERVGGYYDLFEYLINKKVINYRGDLCQKIL
jgi:predicted thioredoxin/glutaredoxin